MSHQVVVAQSVTEAGAFCHGLLLLPPGSNGGALFVLVGNEHSSMLGGSLCIQGLEAIQNRAGEPG